MNSEVNSSKGYKLIKKYNSFNEIDLREIFTSLLRNYRIFSPIILIYLVIGAYDAIRQKDIWQGQFQIVLNQENSQSNSQAIGGIDISRLGAFISSQPVNNLNTQVEILKSSSVLMPVFNFVKDEKNLNGENADGMRYESWINSSLNVELESGTTILNINFKDSNKNLILPTLNKISDVFQKYSIEQTNQISTQTIAYLEKQIGIYEKKSKDSIDDLTDFLQKNNFIFPQLNNKVKNDSNPNFLLNSSALSNALFLMNPNNDIKFEIDKIKQKLALLNNEDNDSERLLAVNMESKSNILSKLYKDLAKVESEIFQKRDIYQEKDIIIKKLKNERIKIINEIRYQSIFDLNSQLQILETNLKINTKPKEVVSEFRELFGASLRNSTTLQNLEKELHIASLQGTKINLPWKLITKPMLFDEPVGPVRIAIFLQKLVYGTILGSLLVFLYELRKNVIYNERDIQNIVQTHLLEKLFTKKRESWKESINLLINGPLLDKDKGSVVIIDLGCKDIGDVENIENIFRKELLNRKFLLTKDIISAKKFKYKILLIQKGTISKSDLIEKINRIAIQKIDLEGYLLIE